MEAKTKQMVHLHGATDSQKLALLHELYSEQLRILGEYMKAYPGFNPQYTFTDEAPGTLDECLRGFGQLCWQLEQYRQVFGRIENDPEAVSAEQLPIYREKVLQDLRETH